MAKRRNTPFKFRFPDFIFILLIIVSGLFLGFSSGSFILNFKNIGFSIFSSLDKGVHYVVDGVVDSIHAVGELHRLKKDYEALLVKVENYEEMKRTNADIRKENERLKEQLDYSTSRDEKNIPCQIISRDLDNTFSYFTIDKGSVNGIKKNMPVIAIQNGNQGLVGKVIQVGTFTSQVMPIYNSNNIVSVRIQNTRDLGLVNGMGSQDQPLFLQYIRKRVVDELNIGDAVVTSGENDNYMKDVPVGTISKITILDYNSSLNIELQPVIDFARLENVIVVNQKELNDRK